MSLRSTERQLVTAFLVILAALILVAKVQAFRSSNILNRPSSHVAPVSVPITISGAVAKPGTFEIKAGSTVRKALNRAHPKNNANLRELDLNAPILKPMNLEIEELTEIRVQIRIDRGPLQEITLPAKSRISDLKSILPLKEVADPSFFKSRRVLKDGEIIEIRSKLAENQKTSYDL